MQSEVTMMRSDPSHPCQSACLYVNWLITVGTHPQGCDRSDLNIITWLWNELETWNFQNRLDFNFWIHCTNFHATKMFIISRLTDIVHFPVRMFILTHYASCLSHLRSQGPHFFSLDVNRVANDSAHHKNWIRVFLMPETGKNERSFEKNELILSSIWWIPRMSVKCSSYQEKLLT